MKKSNDVPELSIELMQVIERKRAAAVARKQKAKDEKIAQDRIEGLINVEQTVQESGGVVSINRRICIPWFGS